MQKLQNNFQEQDRNIFLITRISASISISICSGPEHPLWTDQTFYILSNTISPYPSQTGEGERRGGKYVFQ